MTSTKRCTRRGRFRVGRVSLYQHHAAWWIYFREAGVAQRKRVGPDLASARQVAAEVNAQLESARPTQFAFEPVNLNELVRRWLDFHEFVRCSSLATIRRYRAAIQHVLDYTDAVARPHLAHEIAVDPFIRYLRTIRVSPNGHPRTPRRPLRAKGIQFILEACRSLYSYGARHRLLPPYFENPFSGAALEVSRPSIASEIHALTPEQAARVLECCDDWQFCLFYMLAVTGMRPGELLHLSSEDCDLKAGMIRIRNKPALGWNVKTRRGRAIPIFDETIDLINRMLKDRSDGVLFRRRRFWTKETPLLNNLSQAELEQVAHQRASDMSQHVGRELTRWECEKVFGSVWRDAGAIRGSRIRVEFMRVTRRTGLRDVTSPRILRHSFATSLQDANVDPLIRQQVLGHSPEGGRSGGGLGVTAVYTHTRPETYRAQIRSALALMPDVLRLATERLSNGTIVRAAASSKEAV